MKPHLTAFLLVVTGVTASAYGAAQVEPTSAPSLSTVQRAESTVAVIRDKDGCTITHASNSRFSPVGVDSYRNADSLNLILHETFERGDNDCLEQVQGKVTVDAMVYDRDFKNPKPLWSFSTEGWEGGPEPEGHWRFVGLLDNAASMSFSQESGGADDAIGVLYFASDREPGETLVLHGHKGDAYHYADLKFVMRGKVQKDRQLDLWSADKSKDPKSITGFSIRGALECECDRPLLTFEVPVVDGHLSAAGAKSADKDVTFSAGPSH